MASVSGAEPPQADVLLEFINAALEGSASSGEPAYAAGDLTAEQAAVMIVALPGREETAFEYGWRADPVRAGLVTCGGCGGDLTPDMTVGVITFACPADGCGRVRIAARVLVPAVVEQALERLRTAAAAALLLALAHRRGAEPVPPDTTSVESWWASTDPDAQKELLALLIDHVIVKPVDGAGLDVAARLSLAWHSACVGRFAMLPHARTPARTQCRDFGKASPVWGR